MCKFFSKSSPWMQKTNTWVILWIYQGMDSCKAQIERCRHADEKADLTYIQLKNIYCIWLCICSVPMGQLGESLFESCLLSCEICKMDTDWNVLSVSLPTCGQWCRARVGTTAQGITQCYYFTICIIIILSPFPSPLFFCSTSIRVVLDCRVGAQCSL